MLPMMRHYNYENSIPVPIEDTKNKYYILLKVSDKPGVIGTIGTICGKNNINFANLLQKDSEPENGLAEVVLVTARCYERDVQSAIKELSENDCINKVVSMIRVMD